MTAPERLVPRADDAEDGALWLPLDDQNATVMALRPGHAPEPDFPVTLRLGREPSHIYLLSREEARRLADALAQADEVAGGAA